SEAVVNTAADRLAGVAEVEVPEFVAAPAPGHLDSDGKELFLAGQDVYFRDGHCATCHQANGKGLDPAFPSISNSAWVSGDDQRLIKLALYGLIGPLEVDGKKYNGQVPMTPFGGLLGDDEMAAVLTFVRNSFGNKADPIQPDDIKAVRDENPGRVMFMSTQELLKQHPFNE
ncbi:cytochrome c, partial [Verrucomicrobia bacterium]|nr:cytochrome c [Verrucomicrobiota bacterium]